MTNTLQNVIGDLRQKKLWPVALVLLIALIAVPVLLAKSSPAPSPVTQAPPATAPSSTAVPAVSVSTSPTHSKLDGHSRNPFLQQGGGAVAGSSSTVTSGTSASTGSSTTTSGASSSGGSSVGGSSAGSSGAGGSSTGGSSGSTPTPKPAPTPPGLTSKQTYSVALSVTNSSGGFNTIDPLERLSILPSASQPMVVELGVLQGGDRVLFAVLPGTSGKGRGRCTPGPIDCQILSLAPNQTETMSSNGESTQLAVTGINVAGHPSAAAANHARQAASAAGRRLLRHTTLSALSLFQYRLGVGAVVDLSNLTVGGH